MTGKRDYNSAQRGLAEEYKKDIRPPTEPEKKEDQLLHAMAIQYPRQG